MADIKVNLEVDRGDSKADWCSIRIDTEEVAKSYRSEYDYMKICFERMSKMMLDHMYPEVYAAKLKIIMDEDAKYLNDRK